MAIHLITLSILIAAVMLVRAVFRKRVSARLIYALWLVVAVKLCMPFSLFAVDLSLPQVSSTQPEPTAVQTQGVPEVTKAPAAIAGAQILPQQPIADPPTVPAAPITPIAPTVTEPAVVTPIETEVIAPAVPTVVEKEPVDWAYIAQILWFAGSAAMAVWFAVTGAVFQQELCADRCLHTTVGRTKVYISQSAGAPCLAGLLPAIYLTPEAANSASKEFVIAHEYTHLRHGDHIWAALRTLALIVYWWNPFVWAAAIVSKQDAELACDEGVAAKLDDAGRIAYARTILDTIPQKHAHAVGLGSAPIKERLLMLTNKHKNRAIAAVLAVLLTLSAVGCSFIGPKETTEDTPDLPSSITTTSSATTEVTTTADAVADTPDASESPFRVLANDGNVNIHTLALPLEGENMRYYDTALEHDARYRVLLRYDRDSALNQCHYNAMYIVDALRGEIVGAFTLDASAGYPKIAYTDDGSVIYAAVSDENGVLLSYYALGLTEENGVFTVRETELQADDPTVVRRFVSAEGKHTGYQTQGNHPDDGAIYVRSSDGGVKLLCENKTGDTVGITDVTVYSLSGFADDTHLVYAIGGWEWSKGYGIYNTDTGENTEVLNGKSLHGIFGGALYCSVSSEYVTQKIWRADMDGGETLVASRDAADGVFVMPEEQAFILDHSMWYTYPAAEGSGIDVTQVAFYSPDFDKQLAVIEYSQDIESEKIMPHRFLVYDDSITVVVPTVYTMPEEGNAITSLADWDTLNSDGEFPADGNCYELINGLVHFGGKPDLADRYPELLTVQISDYTISRRKDEELLYFDFTVAESGLDTLPVGKYQTTIRSFYGPQSDDAYMQILSCDAQNRIQTSVTQSDAIRYLSMWFFSQLTWDTGDYGKYDTSTYHGIPGEYLGHYAEYAEEKALYTPEELNVLTKDKLGIELSLSDPFVQENMDESGKIRLSAGIGGFAFIYDILDVQIGEEADTITVQHYNDVNKLIESVKVAYTIGHTGRIYGCELLKDAKYAPFGILGATAYKYKGWQPMG
ncbi:MAG: hypothetical protein IJX64_03235 [Clostridia bacterium]|nr:hypothetical protein [Clostridia bacterium]